MVFSFASLFSQNVGIGVEAPAYKLDIACSLQSSLNLYAEGFVGVGTTTPSYKLQVNNGPVAFFQYDRSKNLVLQL